MFYLISLLFFFSENGINYNDESKTILIQVTSPKLDDTFIVPKSVQEIKASSRTDSAFYQCRSGMNVVKFEEGSEFTTMGELKVCNRLLSVRFSSNLYIIYYNTYLC